MDEELRLGFETILAMLVGILESGPLADCDPEKRVEATKIILCHSFRIAARWIEHHSPECVQDQLRGIADEIEQL